MKKLTTFLTLLMLFMGTGQTWAGYSESNGVKTWDFTTGFGAQDLRNAGFTQDGNTHQYYKDFAEYSGGLPGETSSLQGLSGLRITGHIVLYDVGGDFLVQEGRYMSMGIPVNAGDIVSVTGYFASGARDVSWSGLNEATTKFGASSTTLGGVASSNGWVGITTNNNNRAFHITKIQVRSSSNAPSLSFSTGYNELDLIQLDYEEPNLNISNFPEGAQLSFRPSNWSMARIVYPYSGNGVAGSISNGEKFDVMATHKGYCGIIAECKLGDVVLASAQYTVYIKADDYTYEVTNNSKTFTITGAGGVPDRVINQVSFIEMQFGDAKATTNLPFVRQMTEGLVATVLDDNGWRHIWLSDGSAKDRNGNTVPANKPFQGTFYTFKPQLDGTLTLNMAVPGNSNAVMVESTALTSSYATFDASNTCTNYTVDVQGGKTYYLYALTPAVNVFSNLNNSSWSVAELHGFTFEPTSGYFEYKGLVLKGGKLYDVDNVLRVDGTGQTLVGNPSGVEYTIIECLGDASATINSSTGVLNIDAAKGGAIAVGAKIGSENRDYYMITVPYTKHDWFFTESVQSPSKLTHNDYTQTAWAFNYKVSRPDQTTRKYIELKDAVLCNARDITGNNAGFFAQTAGLVFKSSPRRFGTNTTFDFSDYADVISRKEELGDQYEQELHNIIADYVYNRGINNLTNEHVTDYITMATHSSLIIPNLKQGQYVRIWWRRHAGKDNTTIGDLYSATNVKDLAGNPIASNFYAGNGNGYEEFLVAEDGDVSFTLEVEGGNGVNELVAWTDIFRVTVGEVGEFLETSLIGRMDNGVNASDQVLGRINVEDPSSSLPHPVNFSTNYRTMYSVCNDGTGSKTMTLSHNNGTTGTKGFGESFAIAGYYGTAPTLSGNNKLTVSGTGIAGIVTNITSGGYVIDTDTITIAYGVVEPRNYPYTWDFTNVGTLTGTLDNLGTAAVNGTGAQASWYMKDDNPHKMTADQLKAYKQWEAKNGEYQLNVYHMDTKSVVFGQGSQLVVNGQALPDAQGLGIYLKKASNHYNDYATGDAGQNYLRIGKGYLQFINEPGNRYSFIRVPAVPAGAKVYICAAGETTPSVYTGEDYFRDHALNVASQAEQSQLASNDDGTTYVYENANGGDVLINVSGLKVYKLAVTGTFKTLADYQGKSYATESRNHNEKYDLSGYFTGKEISASKVTGYAESEKGSKIEDDDYADFPLAGKLNLEPVDVAPASTGVILQGEGTGFSQLPLFVKDINTNEDQIGTNYMVPSDQTPSNPYILSMTYTKLDADGNPTDEKGSGPLAFYKMVSGSLGANKAYFDMPQTQMETVTKTYALSAGQTFNSGQTETVWDGAATITYGVSGGANFNAASENSSVSGFTAFTSGNGQNGTENSGTVYTINPKYNGTIEVAVVLNADKEFYVLEDGTALSNYNGITVSDKYYGTYSFPVNANSTYKVYCTGSKLGFYGFKYTYQKEASSTGNANYFMFTFIDGDEDFNEADGIERISLDGQDVDVMAADAIFYNLSGQKLQGKPTQRGIYICNGKKVYVK